MASSTSNFRAALFGIITLLAIVGNTLVAYVLIKRRKILLKNRATYQFILNLTISDLVIVVFFARLNLHKNYGAYGNLVPLCARLLSTFKFQPPARQLLLMHWLQWNDTGRWHILISQDSKKSLLDKW